MKRNILFALALAAALAQSPCVGAGPVPARNVAADTVSARLQGDVNLDGAVDVADIASVISAMTNGSTDVSSAKADVNLDGAVDVADIASVISIMSGKTVAPAWAIDWTYNQERPDWQEPQAGRFENFSVMLVQIEDALWPYTNDDDMMALFVGDELRGVSGPAITLGGGGDAERPSFLLKAYGNENDGQNIEVTLMYYSSRLKQIFARSANIVYSMDVVVGIDEDFIPQFTLGSTKYPIVTALDAAPLLDEARITPADGDRIAAFVDGECRGISHVSSPQSTTINIYSRNVGESVTVDYYQAATSLIYTFEIK